MGLPKLDPEATTTYTPSPGRAFLGATLAGKYEITGILGVGGMGVVCEARHRELGGRRFAVKLVQRYFAGSDLAIARFRREVRAVAAIESENIVQITDVGTDVEFGLFMVMEYLQGEDLATHLHRVGRLPPVNALRIAHQIARGLGKAHAANIIHRDLKPGNVFLVQKDDGSVAVKIFDFGISKLIGDPDTSGTWSADLTGVGMPVGTPQYMSPEQANGAEDLDARTDVWALGAVLFEMLSGRSPYEPRGRAHHTIMRIMMEEPPRLESVAPWVPPAIARIVNAALTRDRDLRIPDCQSFAELLEQAIPAAFRRPEPARAMTDDEVTVVAPPPRSNPSFDGPVPPVRGMMPTTPLPEQFSPYAPTSPASGPPSHMRVVQDKEEKTVVIDLPTPTPPPALAPTTAARTRAPRRARNRAATNLLVLALAIAATAVAYAGHAQKGHPVARTYAAAPASR